MIIGQEELEQVLQKTRLKPRMRDAMRNIFVHGKTQAEAARLSQVSRQAVNYAVLNVAMRIRQNMP
jgi:predicted DNA-binding protein (UPF0251 family)